MNDAVYSSLAKTISDHQSDILQEWLDNQRAEGTFSRRRCAQIVQRQHLVLIDCSGN
jgi:hypothetical protein